MFTAKSDLQAVLECHVAAFGEEDEASLRDWVIEGKENLLGCPGLQPVVMGDPRGR